MKKLLLIICFYTCSGAGAQQQLKRVLFLGNSYTQSNNLPQITANAAASTGDTLQFDSHTPGGYTLQGHSGNATSLSKIAAGNFDFLVLQEQSQLPTFPDNEVENFVFPYARMLDSISKARNPCTQTVFYMTWGRKDGDASNCSFWPPVCTYEGMDSLLQLRYRMMAERNQALLSPVGAVWKYLRQTQPGIGLYVADGSHPSVAGTYAAACSFYSVLFRKDPEPIRFDAGLPAPVAATIRMAVKTVVYERLPEWHIGRYDPEADFSWTAHDSLRATFSNQSLRASTCVWDFGDGNSSTSSTPQHRYSSPGNYWVTLTVNRCGLTDSAGKMISVRLPADSSNENLQTIRIFPNPFTSTLQLRTSPALTGTAYCLYDIAGQLLLKGVIRREQTVLQTAGLPAGLYLLHINGSHPKTYRLIKH